MTSIINSMEEIIWAESNPNFSRKFTEGCSACFCWAAAEYWGWHRWNSLNIVAVLMDYFYFWTWSVKIKMGSTPEINWPFSAQIWSKTLLLLFRKMGIVNNSHKRLVLLFHPLFMFHKYFHSNFYLDKPFKMQWRSICLVL